VSFCLVTALSCGLVAFAGVLRPGERTRIGRPDAAVADPRR
jgi:hypothetical protein